MKTKKVKDLMVPVQEYATVRKDATLMDAILTLQKAQETTPPDRPQFRAVLVLDNDNKIIGKVGHLAFVKAFEPKYWQIDSNDLKNSDISPELINVIMDSYDLWNDNLLDICSRANNIKVKDIMHDVTEHIEEDAPIAEAIHKIIMWQTLSLLVTRKNEIVGIIRLSDIYKEIVGYVLSGCVNK